MECKLANWWWRMTDGGKHHRGDAAKGKKSGISIETLTHLIRACSILNAWNSHTAFCVTVCRVKVNQILHVIYTPSTHTVDHFPHEQRTVQNASEVTFWNLLFLLYSTEPPLVFHSTVLWDWQLTLQVEEEGSTGNFLLPNPSPHLRQARWPAGMWERAVAMGDGTSPRSGNGSVN